DQAARTLGALLYEDFELLELFGPLGMFGNMQGAVTVRTVAERPGLVRSAQGPRLHADHGLEGCPRLDLLLVPGGIGTRTQVDSARLVDWLRTRSGELEVAMTVCTGSAPAGRDGTAGRPPGDHERQVLRMPAPSPGQFAPVRCQRLQNYRIID